MKRVLLPLTLAALVLVSKQTVSVLPAIAAPMPTISTPPPPMMISKKELQPLLIEAGTKYHVDQDLLGSLLKVESGGQVNAVSRTGAQGLMQLMPQTATEMGVADSFVPAQNISGGAAYMQILMKHYHERMRLAVAAYNAGPGAVDHYRGVPPFTETRNYVKRVLTEFNQRKREEKALLAVEKRAKRDRETTA